MDMITQTLAALIGSIALAGCLTDPTLVNVPQPVATDMPENGLDDDGEPLAHAQPDVSDRAAAPNAWAVPPGHLTEAVLALADLSQQPQDWTSLFDPTKAGTRRRGFRERPPPMSGRWSV